MSRKRKSFLEDTPGIRLGNLPERRPVSFARAAPDDARVCTDAPGRQAIARTLDVTGTKLERPSAFSLPFPPPPVAISNAED